MAKIVASVLDADFAKVSEWLPQLEKAKADRIQFDIMDGKFVPNTGVEKRRVAELRPWTKTFFESHLMVRKPESCIEEFAAMGNQLLIFHVEATEKPRQVIHMIKDMGMQAGIAVNNKTPAGKIFPFLHEADLALVMSVNAGFGGQKFSHAALDKISDLRKKIDSEGLQCEIEVDGGVNLETGKKCVKAGADLLVAGTFIFGHKKGVAEAVRELRNL